LRKCSSGEKSNQHENEYVLSHISIQIYKKTTGKEREIVVEISRVIAAVGAVLLVFRAFGMNP
jgi:hypothetical protein